MRSATKEAPQFEHLDLELDGGWLTVWFNQPEQRNTLTAERCAELMSLTHYLAEADHIRGVALRGQGGMFCAGGDLKAFKSLGSTTSDTELAEMSATLAHLLDAFRALPQFTLCIIEGAAVAGGLGLACACDRAIATPDARLSLSEVRIGLVAAQIAPFVLERIGPAQARSLMLLGDWLDGHGALKAGLIDDVFDVDDLATAVTEIRSKLRKTSPQALGQTKSLLRELKGLDRPAQITLAGDAFVAAINSENGQEGLASFAEKRPARWTKEPC